MREPGNMSDGSRKYALITGAYNEENFLERTIQSVVSQTVPPVRWIIVDDSSTDHTPEIVARYARQYNFIELLQLRDPHPRDFTAHVVAINAGYESVKNTEFDFIGNLDADIAFEPDYFHRLLRKFEEYPQLGLAGGFLYEEQNGELKARRGNSVRSVPNAVQLFRRGCYEAIGGYLPLKYGAPDWCAEVRVRMKGWRVYAFPDLKVIHLRPTGSADGRLRNMYRNGLVAFSLGSHPIFELLKSLRRIPQKPFGLASLAMLAGLASGYLRREKRQVSEEFIRSLRDEQRKRMWAFLLGRSQDFAELEPPAPCDRFYKVPELTEHGIKAEDDSL